MKRTTPQETVTQGDLERVFNLQVAQWLAGRAAQTAANKLIARIEGGAKVESGALAYDATRRFVVGRPSGR